MEIYNTHSFSTTYLQQRYKSKVNAENTLCEYKIIKYNKIVGGPMEVHFTPPQCGCRCPARDKIKG